MEAWIVTHEYVVSVAFRRWGVSVKKTGVKHWNGPCPVCGGKDRFYVMDNGRCVCNQCDFRAWLDDDQKFRPDPLILQHRAEVEAKEKEEKAQRWTDWSNGFLAGFYWREWHDHMADENIQWWRSQGITQQQIDYYELGFLSNKTIEVGGERLAVPAYTIPIHCPETWDIVNIHYRLADPPQGTQKYRYEHGIPAREFYAEAGVNQGKVIVVEGAKKAMVTYDRIDAACQVVGLTSCTPSEEMISRISRYYGKIWLALDPGCAKQEERFRKIAPQTLVVRLPDKVDDLFIAGMTKEQFREYLRQGR